MVSSVILFPFSYLFVVKYFLKSHIITQTLICLSRKELDDMLCERPITEFKAEGSESAQESCIGSCKLIFPDTAPTRGSGCVELQIMLSLAGEADSNFLLVAFPIAFLPFWVEFGLTRFLKAIPEFIFISETYI